MFNALKYTQELEKAGFSREQAEVSVRLLIDVMNENLATKSDLKELRADLKATEHSLRSDLKATELCLGSEIKEIELKLKSSIQELKSSVRELEYKMTIKLGTMMTLAIGVTATLVKML